MDTSIEMDIDEGIDRDMYRQTDRDMHRQTDRDMYAWSSPRGLDRIGLIMVLSMDSRVPTEWLLAWQMSDDSRRRVHGDDNDNNVDDYGDGDDDHDDDSRRRVHDDDNDNNVDPVKMITRK